LITISDLGKAYGGQTLFTGVTLQLNPGERYGFVGANGAGKSTFARMLCGTESATDGLIAMPKRTRVGFLQQDRFESDAQRILDVAMMGDEQAWRAMNDKEKLLGEAEPDADRLGALEEQILAQDGYTLEARAAEVLEGLGIPAAVHNDALGTLSGGFKLRALLAQALASRPDLLVLDEPTNHLDIVSIRWLEKFLFGFTGVAVIVSHDRRFLDNVCTSIADVDYETITIYPGNYERFVAQKAADREQRQHAIAKRKAEIAEHQAFIDRFKAQASKARQAQSRMKQMEKIEVEPLPESSRRSPAFSFPPQRPSGKEVLTVEEIKKAYGDNQVLDGVSLSVRRGERIAILGENGIGKSTLLRILTGDLKEDGGEIRWGHETHVGYFPQESAEILPAEGTVYTWLQGELASEPITKVRGRLGAVLLGGDDADKPLRALSGGEAARLVFARLAAEQPNVLVLDEPTNHLDIESIEALCDVLTTYEGTLIVVSHDRWFVGRIATRIIEIRRDGMRDFPGTYAEYVTQLGSDHLDVDQVTVKVKREKKEKGKGKKPRHDEAMRRRVKLEKQRDKATAAVERAEARLGEIEQAFCASGYFESTPAEDVKALQDEQAELQSRVEKLMSSWEELEAELESMAA